MKLPERPCWCHSAVFIRSPIRHVLRITYCDFENPTVYFGGSRAAATSKMGYFVIIVNDFQRLTIITKHSILDVAAALDLPLRAELYRTSAL